MEKTAKTFQITKITAQKQAGRYNIFLNGRFAFGVTEAVLIRYRLLKGMTLDDQQIAAIKQANLQAQAYGRALDYLAYQPRTAHEVAQKLTELEVPADQLQAILARLQAEGLLDDRQYALMYVRTAMRTSLKGPQVIRQKLAQKGVGPADIAAGLAEFTPAQQETNAKKLAEKLYRRYAKLPPRRQTERVRQALLVQGYDGSIYAKIKDQLTLPTLDPDVQSVRLDREATKAWRHYQREAPVKRRLKIKQRLWRKGYDLNQVDAWLNSHDSRGN